LSLDPSETHSNKIRLNSCLVNIRARTAYAFPKVTYKKTEVILIANPYVVSNISVFPLLTGDYLVKSSSSPASEFGDNVRVNTLSFQICLNAVVGVYQLASAQTHKD